VPSVRIWIDETNSVFRQGLVSCLVSEGFHVVGHSCRFVPDPVLSDVDVLIFDIDNGLPDRLSAAARDSAVELIALVDSGHSKELLSAAIEAGVTGFLFRSRLSAKSLATEVGAMARERLSRRETRVLSLLAEGKEMREIAGLLSYSERTVKNILHDSMVKLSCRTRAHAVAFALRRGLI
jgi:DNA-binding NarL/FixJ family response regulator